MYCLSAQNLSMYFGDRLLFDSVSFDIGEKDKLGFVGANGTGKTTVLKVITGELFPSGGQVVRGKETKIGYLEQHVCEHAEHTVYEELLGGFQPLIALEAELHAVNRRLEETVDDPLLERQMVLQTQFEQRGGLTYQSRTRATLLGLGFQESEFSQPVKTLSGGQKSKLSMAKLLLSDANLLLLDEPTNHLDIQSVEWLEEFIRSYQGAVLVISHDRYFLDRVTDKTMELEHQKLRICKGNYSKYLQEKQKLDDSLAHRYKNQMREIKRIEGIIKQQKQWNRERNIRIAESKQKMVDRLKSQLVKPDAELKTIGFAFEPASVSGNDVLQCEGVSKAFGEKGIFQNADFELFKGERVFLLGANGCGKTTLIKIINRELSKDSGRIQYGANVKIGYFEQAHTNLHPEKTVLDEVWDDYRRKPETEIRNALAAFLFTGDSVFQKVSALSGGERAKIALLKLMLSGANLLLLDEPTNHLDIGSREALEEALLGYDGTMLVISHDRFFINKMADRILFLERTGISDFSGNYDAYKEKIIANKTGDTTVIKAEPKQNDYRLRKERESEKRRLKGRISRLEAEIEALELQVEACEAALQADADDYQKVMALSDQLHGLNDEKHTKYEEWESLSESLLEFEE